MSNSSSSKRNNLLGLLFVGWLIAFGITVLFVWWLYSFLSTPFSASQKNLPPELKEARIIKGEVFLTKTEFFKQRPLSISETVLDTARPGTEEEREIRKNSNIAKEVYGYEDLKFNAVNDEIVSAGRFGA